MAHPDLAGANQLRLTFTPLFPIQAPPKPEDQRATEKHDVPDSAHAP